MPKKSQFFNKKYFFLENPRLMIVIRFLNNFKKVLNFTTNFKRRIVQLLTVDFSAGRILMGRKL